MKLSSLCHTPLYLIILILGIESHLTEIEQFYYCNGTISRETELSPSYLKSKHTIL